MQSFITYLSYDSGDNLVLVQLNVYINKIPPPSKF